MTGAQAPLDAGPARRRHAGRYGRVALRRFDLELSRNVSDVLGTGWYAADAARVQAGSTVAVVGDGAVGLMGVLAAKQMDAERIIAMSRHKTPAGSRARTMARPTSSPSAVMTVSPSIKELTKNIGADFVLECVGTKESMMQALQCARPGSMIGYVGVPHGVEFDGQQLFFSQRGLLGGPAPVRRFLPHLMDLVLGTQDQSGQSLRSGRCRSPMSPRAISAMDERRAIKVLAARIIGRTGHAPCHRQTLARQIRAAEAKTRRRHDEGRHVEP